MTSNENMTSDAVRVARANLVAAARLLLRQHCDPVSTTDDNCLAVLSAAERYVGYPLGHFVAAAKESDSLRKEIEGLRCDVQAAEAAHDNQLRLRAQAVKKAEDLTRQLAVGQLPYRVRFSDLKHGDRFTGGEWIKCGSDAYMSAEGDDVKVYITKPDSLVIPLSGGYSMPDERVRQACSIFQVTPCS